MGELKAGQSFDLTILLLWFIIYKAYCQRINMTEPRKVLFEVREVADRLVAGLVRDSGGGVFGISLPRFMCPDVACIPGGSFYLQTETVNPIEEQKELDKIFRGI